MVAHLEVHLEFLKVPRTVQKTACRMAFQMVDPMEKMTAAS